MDRVIIANGEGIDTSKVKTNEDGIDAILDFAKTLDLQAVMIVGVDEQGDMVRPFCVPNVLSDKMLEYLVIASMDLRRKMRDPRYTGELFE